MKVSREILSVAAKVAIYPARLVQLGSLVITGYAVCYLVWMHHFHYCAFYGCGARVPDGVSVPLGEVLLITASVLVTLEWMLFGTILALKADTGKPAIVDTSAQFACSCFSLFVYSIGLVAFTSIPTVRATWPYCYNMWGSNVYDPPEKYFCIVTQNAVTCGLIAWIATMLVALLNLIQFRKDRAVGAIRLGDDTRSPTDADAVSIPDVTIDHSA
ncbi:hypothetical protein MRS44_012056 [Fusarium solani]|uniref:Uncharacterized protein n=1 Tax=Fusarium solani TaxID=169388 RepID=A0A9P9KN10_FUSSL|nr:uncharacterized protein B0J15DRAFT_511643 [Fusarium solani]KAH7264630.1 hypothetical protein B0J15DRAFT_511643 [Fusarium solani]KAJ3457947.1 hypothetical protein MRS44_012056 [Fusarium solani]